MRRERRSSLDIPATTQASFGDLSLSSQMMYLAMVETWRILRAVLNGDDVVENQIGFDPTGRISEESSRSESKEEIEDDDTEDEDEKNFKTMTQNLNCRRMSLPARMPDIIQDSTKFKNVDAEKDAVDSGCHIREKNVEVNQDSSKHPEQVNTDVVLPDFVPAEAVFPNLSPDLVQKTIESRDFLDDYDGVIQTIYHRKNDSHKPFRVNNQWAKQQGCPHQSVKFASVERDDRLLSGQQDERDGQVQLWRQTGKDLHRIAMSRQHGLEDSNSVENSRTYTLHFDNEFTKREARNRAEGQRKVDKKLQRRNSDVNRTKDFVDGSSRGRRNRRFSVAGTNWVDNAPCHQNQVNGKKSLMSDICTMISVLGLYICVRKIEKLFK